MNRGLTRQHKGIVFVAVGIVLLLYAFGIFARWLNVVMILTALASIFYGLYKLGVLDTLIRRTK